MTRGMRMKIVALALASMLAGACGPSAPDRLEFGVQRIALDIAFVDEDAAPPPAPEVIVQLIPAPPEVYEPGFDYRTVEVSDELEDAPRRATSRSRCR
jgi:hypothetical protein